MESFISDFTLVEYQKLLQLAKTNYKFATYCDIPWGDGFLLWRHDCDFSLNRALKLAALEAEEDIKSTYFIHINSSYYNVYEKKQYELVKAILGYGHYLGVHVDSFQPFFATGQYDLDKQVQKNASILGDTFGVDPVAFSFHDPSPEQLGSENEFYGGLVNCYSRRFKQEVGYCSDSNGYWAYRRLFDVLTEKQDTRLQVLTHPGWWQDKPMPPRQRIFRSAYGRASSTMRFYDQALEKHGRLNHAGPSAALQVLKDSQKRHYELCDFLWNQGAFETLFVELWRLHEAQINQLSKAKLRKEWAIPEGDVNALFATDGVAVDGWRLFEALFETHWHEATGISEQIHKDWIKVRNQLIHARSSIAPAELEQGCIYLCGVMNEIATWGLKQSVKYDGLARLGSIGLPTSKTAEGSLEENLGERPDALPKYLLNRWQVFLQKLASLTEK